MPLTPIVNKAYWLFAAAGAAYFVFISLLLNENIQRFALYAHRFNTAWWYDLNQPDQWGFLKNQVQPFNISTPDGAVLYAWHILPLAIYAADERRLINEPPGLAADITQTRAFHHLRSDPSSLLVINFHGNAGTVAQGWRTDTYRTLASANPQRIHILAFDYRGFGLSTGSPTEPALISDGIAITTWALDVARIPPERILLVGQSLGTAVATAVAEHFAVLLPPHQPIDFHGLVLVAAFADIPSLVLSYAIGNIIPLLSPLQSYPRLQRFFTDRIVDRWGTADRLANLVRRCRTLNMILIHARDDRDIPWSHSDALFYAAANATGEEGGLSRRQVDGVKERVDWGRGAGWRNTWTVRGVEGGRKRVRQVVVRYGGHNRIMTYAHTAWAVYALFHDPVESDHIV